MKKKVSLGFSFVIPIYWKVKMQVCSSSFLKLGIGDLQKGDSVGSDVSVALSKGIMLGFLSVVISTDGRQEERVFSTSCFAASLVLDAKGEMIHHA